MMDKCNKEPLVGFIVRLPASLHKKLKIVCAERDVFAKDLFMDYVESLEVKGCASGK